MQGPEIREITPVGTDYKLRRKRFVKQVSFEF